MNGAPRKVKNPLLSAAGSGFPFDSYTENTLLMPVTPATPAVFRDDAELDNFIGQEPVNIQSQISSKTFENFSTNAPSPPNESKYTTSQPTKPGYLTSILSSLPNLSLSSTKPDFSGLQTNQTFENTGEAIREPNSYIPSQGYHDSQPKVPGFLAINPQDSSSADVSGFAALSPPRATSDSPQPAAPPQVSSAPVSYRLGNQRRLKYAPPPDLTSNNTKSYPSPPIQTFFPDQNVLAPPRVILNPYMTEELSQGNNSKVQQTSFLPEQASTSEKASLNSSLHSSFRSSPIATTHSSSVASTDQNPFYETSSVSAPLQFASSSSRPILTRVLEPATPQNTPATISFPQFYAPPSNVDKDVVILKNSNQSTSLPELTRNNTLVTTVGSAKELNVLASIPNEENKATFTPISAAKVTEKLEHLLAKQEENSFGATTSSDPQVEIASNVTTELTKSSESQSDTSQANKSIDKLYEAKASDVQRKDAQAGSDTWSDVSLGQESTAQSVICPEVNTADNNPVVTDVQETKSNALPSQQQDYYQDLQPTPMPSSTFYASKPAVQKSSLNYVSSVQPPQQSAFHNPPAKPSEQSGNLFFESAEQDRFPNFSSQESSANISLGRSVVENVKTNTEQVGEKSAFSSVATNLTSHVPYWNANQSSQPQILNTISNQPTHIAPNQPTHTVPSQQVYSVPSQSVYIAPSQSVYTAPSQPVYTAPNQSSVPLFYNPAQFTNELPKQTSLPHTYDQHSSQQQSYKSTPSYGSSELQQPYTVLENNTTYSSPVTMATSVPEPTGSATLSPVQMSVNSPTNRTTPDTVPPSFQNWASGSSDKRMQYRPLYHHWFYRKEVENKTLWLPFSMQDSLKLEEVHNSSDITPETTVATDGGRYDVDILRRQRVPVYWIGVATEVRRCSWFYKGATESRYLPYNENTAAKLEEEYKQACLTNNWNRRIDLNNGEYIVFHSATVQAHYLQSTSPELAGSWGNSAGSEDSAYLQGAASRPRVVKRGVDEFNIDEGEPEKVDHLLFLVHGIGSVCDLKFRTVEEVVDEFRSISLQLVQSHYRTACEQGIVNRIEVLPISWHTTLHSDTGIDKKLQAITLESIPKLRHFTNDTLLDILFYTSPIYCQTIMQTVGSELNRLHALFKERNPNFNGGVYLGGHSLGSLIMFDLLCHQKPAAEEDENRDDGSDKGENENAGLVQPMPAPVLKRRLSKKISYVMGAAGTGQPYIHYPQLNFHPRAFFALGSPIGMFVTVRGIDTLGKDFTLPTCPAFFNIFHPFDPVAYRVESLINPEACKFRPMLIPHHKGRKRMHLELKETMARVGADLKQKLIDSVRHTWNSFYQLALFHKPDNQVLEREIDKVVEEQLQNPPTVPDQHNEDAGADLKIGILNGGRRIDYVLQEAPFEYINEYIFALTSHICYWESEDTMLLILKEIYGSRGIQTDAQLPQQTLSIERVSPSPSLALSHTRSNASISSLAAGADLIVPESSKPIGPPPTTGFVPKS